ncbi:unnamed protein product [Rhodiola kirilowii]
MIKCRPSHIYARTNLSFQFQRPLINPRFPSKPLIITVFPIDSSAIRLGASAASINRSPASQFASSEDCLMYKCRTWLVNGAAEAC